jgi:hypothetical protein
LRPKPWNPPPPWFWGSTKKPTAGFEAKQGETVSTSFEAKLEKIVTTGFDAKLEKIIAADFDAKLLETVATSFEAKPAKIVQVVLRPNHLQTVAIDFEAQTDEKPSQWFWGQTTDKPSTLVLRLNQETWAPHLHVHGADRTWRHPSSRSPGHRVPDLCDHPQSSAPGLLLLPRSSALHAMPHLPPAHHETSKHDSPNETKVKEKQNETVPDEIKPRQVNDSSQSNQGTDHLVSQSPPWWVHWQQKHKVGSSNPKPHEAQLEDPKSQEKLKKVI